MSSNFLFKFFRVLLFPVSLLYWLAVAIRNWMYNKGILKSSSFGLPLICVGNLSVGGTGKSPMVELLVEKLKGDYHVATLSRGYKRKTKGYALANEQSTALEIGDEPMQFHQKFPDVPVAVGERRIEAIPQLIHDYPKTEVIVLDDAFQHRTIKAGLNILLTDCNNLFIHDFYLPTGNLRDQKKSYKRAEILVITKCKPLLTSTEKWKIIKSINLLPHQQIFFTTIRYGVPYHIHTIEGKEIHENCEILLVSGIANPAPLKTFLEENYNGYQYMHFSDHHIFSIDDLKNIKKKFEEIVSNEKIILTTEKDAVRLQKFKDELIDLPVYVLPVKHEFLFGESGMFYTQVHNFINEFKQVKPTNG